MSRTCECGCGQKVKKRFVTHHNLRVQENAAFDPEVSRKKSIGQKLAIAMKAPEERERWIAKIRKSVLANLDHRKYLSESMRMKRRDPSFLRALDKAIPKRSKSIQKAWENSSPKQRALRIRAAAVGCGMHPNRQELRLANILERNFPKQFIINVINCKIIAAKIPDFIHCNYELVVELFGTYWHGKAKVKHDARTEEHFRKTWFAIHGYGVVVVWEHELDDEDLVCEKVGMELAKHICQRVAA